MHGIKVTLYDKVQTGKDPYNAPVYKEVPVQVENVLVAPLSATEIVEALQLHGKKAVYQIGIPKGDEHTWEDRRVDFFGHSWHTIGFVTEGIEDLVPTQWHKKVQVERYEV